MKDRKIQKKSGSFQKIWLRLSILTVTVALVPILILGLFFYGGSAIKEKETFHTSTTSQLQNISRTVQQYFVMVGNDIQLMLSQEQFVNYKRMTKPGEHVENIRSINNRLAEVCLKYPFATSAYFYHPDTDSLITNYSGTYSAAAFYDTEWITDAPSLYATLQMDVRMNANKEYLLDPQKRNLLVVKPEPVITIAGTGFNSSRVAINISVAELHSWIEEIYPMQDSRFYIVDPQGQIVAAKDTRRKIEHAHSSIQQQLERLLRGNPDWFSEAYVTQRGGRSVLPVKKQFRSKLPGTVVETSGSGATCFIEPRSVQNHQNEVLSLEMDKENEIIRILYTLTGVVESYIGTLKQNRESLERLDFLFAKAKLSAQMGATQPSITTKRMLSLRDARHPLLDKNTCVPLSLAFGGEKRGVIITGPNTGGKTVTLKTVGLLSLMAQSGLHIPAHPDSVLCMNNLVLCDIGDGQSITANLSTFSSHMTAVIEILRYTTEQSLVLLDELGSGTDPAEGMGLAVAIIEELLGRNCLFLTTTHYSEVKEFAAKKPAIISARMAFDRENLTPLYQLELGEVGESCAFYIAQRLGLPSHMLATAHHATYGDSANYGATTLAMATDIPVVISAPVEQAKKALPVYNLGDSVIISPDSKVGIVYLPTQPDGTVGVQIQKEKQRISYKRLSLLAPAEQLYPADYDFSIVFDSIEKRKSQHTMGRKHDPTAVLTVADEEAWR